MPRFYFHLRAQRSINHDLEGTECRNAIAARAHARRVAKELMSHSGAETRLWSIHVEDESGEPSSDVLFADVDAALKDFPPRTRELLREMGRQHAALIDVLCSMRSTLTNTRVVIAGASGGPLLVHSAGGRAGRRPTKARRFRGPRVRAIAPVGA